MTQIEIMVLAWPAIGVAAMALFGWWLKGWINRKHPKTVTAKAQRPSTEALINPIRDVVRRRPKPASDI